jgi:actin-like ATPase involved in cell morphogenesis
MTGKTPIGRSEDRRRELVTELAEIAEGLPSRIDVDPEGVERELSKLVLTLVELLRRVVEHQAVQRMDDPDLTEEQVERMGTALWRLEQKMQEIKEVFGLADEELNIDLGPLGRVL